MELKLEGTVQFQVRLLVARANVSSLAVRALAGIAAAASAAAAAAASLLGKE
jgi:hypothetical protein